MDPEVQVAMISAGVAVFLALFGEGWRRQHKAITETRDNSRVVKEQTQNSHDTNLRDDIDDVRDSVREVHHQFTNAMLVIQAGQQRLSEAAALSQANQSVQMEALEGIREDQRLERQERIEVARMVERQRVEVAHKLELLTLATAVTLQQSTTPSVTVPTAPRQPE